MKLKQWLCALTFAALSGAVMAVPTTTTNLGTLDEAGTQFDHSWVRFFGFGSSPGGFLDTYTFGLSAAAQTVGTIFQFDFGSLRLSLDSVSLYKTSDPGKVLGVDTTPGAFSFSNLSAGDYTLNLAGTLFANPFPLDVGLAYYQGSIRAIASPTPEPAAVVMMLAGLVAIGSVVASRRRKK